MSREIIEIDSRITSLSLKEHETSKNLEDNLEDDEIIIPKEKNYYPLIKALEEMRQYTESNYLPLLENLKIGDLIGFSKN